jgi:hypothetical protein
MRHCTSVEPPPLHPRGCGCGIGRRGLLGLAAGLAAALPRAGRAGSGRYDAMLLNCIDPRVTTASFAWMGTRGMRDDYSQFVIAGGPIGCVHPRFAAWHDAFWDNLGISLQLHGIRDVVALTHRDCGAAKLALGEDAVATREAETASHADMLRLFRAEVARRHPTLSVVGGIMALDGSVVPVA